MTWKTKDAPMDPAGLAIMKQRKGSPIESAGLLSRATFSWVTPLMRAGYSRPLQQSDKFELPASLWPEHIGEEFLAAWDKEVERVGCKASSLRVFWKAFGWYVVHALAIQLVVVSLKIGSIILFRMLIQLLSAPDSKDFLTSGLVVAAGLAIFNFLDGFIQSLASHQLVQSIYCCLMSTSRAVLRKGSRLHSEKQDQFGRGSLVTLAFSDFMRLMDLYSILLTGLSAPLLLLIAYIFLMVLFGPLVLPAVTLSVIAFFLIQRIGNMLGKSFRAKSETQGKRVTLLNEMLQSVRFTKFYVLEDHYEAKFRQVREEELRQVLWMRISSCLSWPVACFVPIGTAAVVVCMYLYVHSELPNQADLFATVALARFLYYPFAFFGAFSGAVHMFQATTSRLDVFMQQPEATRFQLQDILPAPGKECAEPSNVAVSIRGRSFTWSLDTATPPTLHSVSLEVPRGELWVIVGELGSGKSSLLEAILGGINPATGSKESAVTVSASSRVFVAQQPMIMNATVKQNVICSDEAVSDEELDAAYSASALWPDLEVLPAGDDTEIGEKGITMSGGQKARVAMARAVLASKPGGLVLLDDPLAAVDAQVGRHLFEECIVRALGGTTRLLVTNQLHFLSNPQVSNIVIMASGSLVEQGSFAELTSDPQSRLSSLLASHGSSDDPDAAAAAKVQADGEQLAKPLPTRRTVQFTATEAGQLTKAEKKQEGSVGLGTFLWYFRALGGYHIFAFGVFMSWMFHLGEILPDIFMVTWREDMFGMQQNHYVVMWVFCGCVGTFMSLTSRLAHCWRPNVAGRWIHSTMLLRVLHCPTSFFDSTPSGRIMNRFGEDLAMVDYSCPMLGEVLLIVGLTLLDCLVLVVIARPITLPFIVAFVGCFFCLREVHRRASRETIRWWMVSKSPMFSIFEEILSGIPTIIAFGREDYFLRRFQQAQFVNLSWVMSKDCTNFWTEQRMVLIGSSVVGTLAAAIVLMPDSTSEALSAISLIHTLQMSFQLKTVAFMSVQVEGLFAAMERVREFCELEQEAAWRQPNDSRLQAESWPASSPTLVFEKACVRYLAHMPRALDGVSFSLNAFEKVGIVGRTGSGKSTIMGVIFRLFELEEGRILLGNVDIGEVGLSLLRRQITIVPQDPILFSGGLRKNLDPLENKSDTQLWESLGRCGLKGLVESLDGKLDARVSEGGTNFSVGERQVLCLARALLRDGKVLCLDEATANVDPTNDKRIQKVLSMEVTGCLVLTIAHRLRTVLGSDRIIVLDSGRLAQLDTPVALLTQPGIFRDLAEQAGISAADVPDRSVLDNSQILLELEGEEVALTKHQARSTRGAPPKRLKPQQSMTSCFPGMHIFPACMGSSL